MVGYVLDTDTLSLLQRANPKVLARVKAELPGRVGVSTVTIQEQFEGWLKKYRTARQPRDAAHASLRLSEAVKLWSLFPILPMTIPAIFRFESLKKQKLNVGHQDLRIAAIALDLGATVVTANTRDFSRVPGLSVVDWSA